MHRIEGNTVEKIVTVGQIGVVMFRTVLCLTWMIVGGIFTAQYVILCNDTFTIWGIRSDRPYAPQFATRSLSPEEAGEVKRALSQPYIYYGCGGQSYVFFSRDDQYVIKFFRQRSLLRRRSASRLLREFSSYALAFNELKELTGVLLCHLNTTDCLQTELEIIDRLKIHHLIDLDRFDFIIQRKAEKVYDCIDRLVRTGDRIGAERAIGSLLALISDRCKRGYRNGDAHIPTNYGFLGEQAVILDVGKLSKEAKMARPRRHNQDLLRITGPLKAWLADRYPELLAVFETQLEATWLKCDVISCHWYHFEDILSHQTAGRALFGAL